MEPRNRFSVPVDELDAVRVDPSEQVEEQSEPRAPGSTAGLADFPPAFGGGGASTDADGE